MEDNNNNNNMKVNANELFERCHPGFMPRTIFGAPALVKWLDPIPAKDAVADNGIDNLEIKHTPLAGDDNTSTDES